MQSATKPRFIYGVIILVSLFLDQLTKYLAVIFLKGEPSFPLWQDVLHLTYHENYGAAFGMLSEHRWVFMTISTVAILALVWYLFFSKKMSFFMGFSFALVLAGGIGNMIDRVFLGYVVDFIDFTLIDFAIFNVADSLVCVGAGLLFITITRDLIKELKAQKLANNTEETETPCADLQDASTEQDNTEKTSLSEQSEGEQNKSETFEQNTTEKFDQTESETFDQSESKTFDQNEVL